MRHGRYRANAFEGIGAIPYDPGLSGRTGSVVNFANGILSGVNLADQFRQRRMDREDRAMQLEDRERDMRIRAEDRAYTLKQREQQEQDRTRNMGISAEDRAYTLEQRKIQGRRQSESDRRMDEDYRMKRALDMQTLSTREAQNAVAQKKLMLSKTAEVAEALAGGQFDQANPEHVAGLSAIAKKNTQPLSIEPAQGGGYILNFQDGPVEIGQDRLSKVVLKARYAAGEIDANKPHERIDGLIKEYEKLKGVWDATAPGRDRVYIGAQLDDIEEQLAGQLSTWGDILPSLQGYSINPDAVAWKDEAESDPRHIAALTKENDKNKPGFWKNDSDESRAAYKYGQAEIDRLKGIGSGGGRPQQPSATGPARPQTEADFAKLPSGTLYIDPDDGKTYKKP